MTKHESEMLDAAADAAQDARNRAKRKKWLLILGSTVLSNAITYGLYSHYYGSKFISTDNAYTAAENAQVTPAISGIVREVRVNDTQEVHKGDVIVVLDDTGQSCKGLIHDLLSPELPDKAGIVPAPDRFRIQAPDSSSLAHPSIFLKTCAISSIVRVRSVAS